VLCVLPPLFPGFAVSIEIIVHLPGCQVRYSFSEPQSPNLFKEGSRLPLSGIDHLPSLISWHLVAHTR
jgi:hypothetical protein